MRETRAGGEPGGFYIREDNIGQRHKLAATGPETLPHLKARLKEVCSDE